MNHIKVNHFVKSVDRFKEVLLENKTDIIRDSAIKRYETCYELAWRSVQELLKNEGLGICNLPKNCFKSAFNLGLIENEIIFSNMVQNRNLTTHTYDEVLANKIYQQFNDYYEVLSTLAQRIRGRG
jgi:nucleotidyltransferase substrate binding protein (TIGR01987 family)